MVRACRVRGCPHRIVGEVTVWRQFSRSPLVVEVCASHLDAVLLAIASVVEEAPQAVEVAK